MIRDLWRARVTARPSTLVLAAVFVLTLAVYFLIRPATAAQTTQTPVTSGLTNRASSSPTPQQSPAQPALGGSTAPRSPSPAPPTRSSPPPTAPATAVSSTRASLPASPTPTAASSSPVTTPTPPTTSAAPGG